MITPPQNNPPGGQRTASGEQNRSQDEIKQTARHLGEEARTQGKQQLEQLRGTAAENLDKLAESAQAAASRLQQDDIGHLSEYVSDVATRMGQLSNTLRTKSIDEVFQDIGRIARENPALFVTGSLAIGFGIARFARASQPKALERDDTMTSRETGGYASTVTSDSTAYAGARTGDSETPRSAYDGGSATGNLSGAGTGASGSPATPTANPINPASSQTGTSSGTQGGIH
ncbi:MAG: hypothetical protein H0W24_10055 [Lysobacter sp.]|nr:hypothetical protein [Lysobacter sp.]